MKSATAGCLCGAAIVGLWLFVRSRRRSSATKLHIGGGSTSFGDLDALSHAALDASPHGWSAIKLGAHTERWRQKLAQPERGALEDTLRPMGDAQVGGHRAAEGESSAGGCLTMPPHFILKPVQGGPGLRGLREIAFYEEMRHATAAANAEQLPGQSRRVCGLERFLPEYHGVACQKAARRQSSLKGCATDSGASKKEEEEEEEGGGGGGGGLAGEGGLLFLVLTDMTAGMARPCAMDVKLGRRTFEPDASEDKKRRELEKWPLQAWVGFRVTGMRYFSEYAANATRAAGKGDDEKRDGEEAAMGPAPAAGSDGHGSSGGAFIMRDKKYCRRHFQPPRSATSTTATAATTTSSSSSIATSVTTATIEAAEACAAAAFGEFLSDGRPNFRRCGLAPLFLERLRELERIFQAQRAFHFTASSLLFVYDAATAPDVAATADRPPPAHAPLPPAPPLLVVSGDQTAERRGGSSSPVDAPPMARANVRLPTERGPAVDVRLIDFAHVRAAGGAKDDNVLYAIQRAISVMERI